MTQMFAKSDKNMEKLVANITELNTNTSNTINEKFATMNQAMNDVKTSVITLLTTITNEMEHATTAIFHSQKFEDALKKMPAKTSNNNNSTSNHVGFTFPGFSQTMKENNNDIDSNEDNEDIKEIYSGPTASYLRSSFHFTFNLSRFRKELSAKIEEESYTSVRIFYCNLKAAFICATDEINMLPDLNHINQNFSFKEWLVLERTHSN